jgi:hypothetical protein
VVFPVALKVILQSGLKYELFDESLAFLEMDRLKQPVLLTTVMFSIIVALGAQISVVFVVFVELSNKVKFSHVPAGIVMAKAIEMKARIAISDKIFIALPPLVLELPALQKHTRVQAICSESAIFVFSA